MADQAPAPASSQGDFAASLVQKEANSGISSVQAASGIDRFARHERRKKGGVGGTIECTFGGQKVRFIDTESLGAIDAVDRAFQGQTISIGDAIDWTARLAIRPTAKTSAAEIFRYGFRSFFVDVSHPGDTSPGLFNMMVAEAISVLFEWLYDVLGRRVTDEDAEISLFRGFSSIAKARSSGITQEMTNQIDNYFDNAVNTFEKAIENGTLNASKGALQPIAEDFGKNLAKKLSAHLKDMTPKEREDFQKDPLAIYDFVKSVFQDNPAIRQYKFIFIDEGMEALRVDRELSRKEIERLTTAAAKGSDGASTPAPSTPLAETKQANWFSRMFGGAGKG